MQDLGTLPGDVSSGGVGINDRGEVVGASLDTGRKPTRVFLAERRDDRPEHAGSRELSFVSVVRDGINSSGEIAGFGAVKSTCMGDPSLCEVHAFLASPDNGPTGRGRAVSDAEGGHSQNGQFALSEGVRRALRERMPFGQMGVRRTGR